MVPMMLQPGWVLERYLGWSLRVARPGLKLLERRYGPLVKWLVLADGVSDGELESVARDHALRGARSCIVLNDFRATDDVPRTLGGCRLEPVRDGRWFGVGTFVVDLTGSEEDLWRRVAERERGKCRAALRDGIVMTVTRKPDGAALDAFVHLHRAMADQREFDAASPEALQRMIADGCLLFAGCRDASGAYLVTNLVYLGDEEAFFLYGARTAEGHAGAGHLAHWETILALKREGYRRYDLGQVPSAQPDDGIYRFKRSFGGSFVAFGSEYQWRSPAWRLAYALRRSTSRRPATVPV